MPTGSAEGLGHIFQAKTIAVAGVSSGDTVARAGMFVDALQRGGFPGKLYAVNPKGGEALGLKIWRSLSEIPEPVDYVICSIPAPHVTHLMTECVAKKVKTVHIFTSGFSETGTEEGRQLEREIAEIARAGGIRVIGPNCMGIYCPKSGLTFGPDFSSEPGPVAYVCQSGGNAFYVARTGPLRGIHFSKAVSYGNGIDVDESNLLEYLTTDAESEIIAVYVEGVRDGTRFRKALTEAAAAKPVIVLKGGSTSVGAQAASSHTGSLAGSDEVWDGLLKQAGALRVYGLEEMVDALVAFRYLPTLNGRRISVVGVSGGAGVLAADDLVRHGFTVPTLTEEIRLKLRSFLTSDYGISLRNPIDIARDFMRPNFYDFLSALAGYDGVDLIVVQLSLGMMIMPRTTSLADVLNTMVDYVIKVHKETGKPIALIIHAMASGENWQIALDCQKKCYEAGLPVFRSMDNAARAINLVCRYNQGQC